MKNQGHRLFAAVYDRMNATAERDIVGPWRERLLGELTGEVLDVGAGTGANLPHLRRASRVVATEPDPAMRRRLVAHAAGAAVPVQIDEAPAEALPYPDASFDAVVFTLVLCSVADPDRAVAEARRVLRPGGRLIVLEHVRGTGRLARWQDVVTPVWSRIGAGCHPGRDTRATVERAGFAFVQLDEFQPVPRWHPASPWLAGSAEPTAPRH
jgi:ubiquinone/menaquinone biosynthesis C-methylase UbiE